MDSGKINELTAVNDKIGTSEIATPYLGPAVAEQVRGKLTNRGPWTILESSQMNRIASEHRLSMSGLMDEESSLRREGTGRPVSHPGKRQSHGICFHPGRPARGRGNSSSLFRLSNRDP